MAFWHFLLGTICLPLCSASFSNVQGIAYCKFIHVINVVYVYTDITTCFIHITLNLFAL